MQNSSELTHEQYRNMPMLGRHERAVWSLVPATIQAGIEAWANADENMGLVLSGSVGIGKTAAMALMIRGLACAGVKPVFMHSHDLFKLFQDFSDDGQQKVKQLRECPWLFIDDLGTEYAKDWNLGEFYSVVNDREMFEKPIVLTTNLSFDQWHQRGPEWFRIIDRIRGQAHDWIELEGVSQR